MCLLYCIECAHRSANGLSAISIIPEMRTAPHIFSNYSFCLLGYNFDKYNSKLGKEPKKLGLMISHRINFDIRVRELALQNRH